jgi:hypothetical protein
MDSLRIIGTDKAATAELIKQAFVSSIEIVDV